MTDLAHLRKLRELHVVNAMAKAGKGRMARVVLGILRAGSLISKDRPNRIGEACAVTGSEFNCAFVSIWVSIATFALRE
jgi:hypothetical protein